MVTDIRLPEIAENVSEGEVVRILVSPDDRIDKDKALIEVETEKASFEVPSPQGGRIVEVTVHKGDSVKVGQAIVRIETDGEASVGQETVSREREERKKQREEERPPEKPQAAAPPAAEPQAAEPQAAEVAAAPSVRREARELGIDIRRVPGSGPGGRITTDDLKRHVKESLTRQPVGAAAPLPDFSRWGEVERRPMSKVRYLTAEAMHLSWRTAPQVTQFDSADITDVEAFRTRHAAGVERAGGKLTVTAILVKIVAAALQRFPDFNASADMDKREIVRKGYINIGLAIDTERGLLVPVIRDAEKKSLTAISIEARELAEKTRGKTITPDEMKGGCFTISNVGGIGGTGFTPIINYPEVAILGVSRARLEPEYRDGQWVPRFRLPLSLSFDHRVVDGADGARFLRWIVDCLEQPFFMTLEGGV